MDLICSIHVVLLSYNRSVQLNHKYVAMNGITLTWLLCQFLNLFIYNLQFMCFYKYQEANDVANFIEIGHVKIAIL
jgi:hypothetical protein